MTVAITREELGAVELRREARRCRDARAARRMLALALVLEGSSREEAARAAGMDRQTLRDWVHRYNAEGLAGLRDRPRSGRKPRLTPGQEAELAAARARNVSTSASSAAVSPPSIRCRLGFSTPGRRAATSQAERLSSIARWTVAECGAIWVTGGSLAWRWTPVTVGDAHPHSIWNQTSTGLPRARSGSAPATSSAKPS